MSTEEATELGTQDITHVVLYASKSTEDVHESIPGQLDACRAYAEREGWEIAGEHTDEAASGYSGSRGPGLMAAKKQAAALAAEGFDAILLVAVSDRLARGDGKRARHLAQHWFDAQEDDYRLASVTENLGDLMYAVMLGERAHADSAAKSAHVKRGLLAAAQRGRKKGGGRRPFGFVRVFSEFDSKGKAIYVLKPDPVEAAVVRRVFDEVETGRSQMQIARILNEDGITTVTGRHWSQSQVQQVLCNRLYVGDVLLNGQHYAGEHEAIITVEQFDRVRGALSGRYGPRKGGRPSKGSHLLVGGLLKCTCGASMRPRAEQKSHGLWEAYLCAGRHDGTTTCTMKAVAAKRIDAAVLSFFTKWALDLDAMVEQAEQVRGLHLAETRRALREAEAEAASAADRLARVKRAFQDGHVEARDWSEQRAELIAELEGATSALDSLHQREADLSATTFSDAEQETLQQLAELRSAVNREITAKRDDLDALRAAIARVFEAFRLHIDRNDVYSVEVGGTWTLEPVVRPEFLQQPGLIHLEVRTSDGRRADKWESAPTVTRVPMPLSGGEQLTASRR